MSVLIGGCGSTGSTLLRHILNRHPRIFCGPELNFFNKEQLFRNWEKEKHKIKGPSRFLATEGWVPYTGTRLLNPQYGWTRKYLYRLIDSAHTIREFADKYFMPAKKRHNADIWIEKTPSNVYCFKQFLNQSPKNKVIHLARSPYATVASYVNRGYSPIFSAGMYIYNMSSALKVRKSSNYHYLKYEDLLQDPEKQLSAILAFLKFKFENKILIPKENEKRESIGSWQNQPNQTINRKKKSQFEAAPLEIQKEIITALSVFRIRSRVARQKALPFCDCESLCQVLGYDFEPEVYPSALKSIKIDLAKDHLKRSLKFYPTGWFNFPAELSY
ncbi:MAG: sulfotransferase family protein [Fidelibacterota bacterium]